MPEWQSNCFKSFGGSRVLSLAGLALSGSRIPGALHGPQSKRGTTVEDPLLEMLSWLFVKSEEEIMVEAEVAALTSMFLAEDPRPERRR